MGFVEAVSWIVGLGDLCFPFRCQRSVGLLKMDSEIEFLGGEGVLGGDVK